MVSVESVGLDVTRVGYSWLMGWGFGPDGARGWVARCKRVGGWVQAWRAAASSEKTGVKGKAIQCRGWSKSVRGRKAASLLENCGSSKA